MKHQPALEGYFKNVVSKKGKQKSKEQAQTNQNQGNQNHARKAQSAGAAAQSSGKGNQARGKAGNIGNADFSNTNNKADSSNKTKKGSGQQSGAKKSRSSDAPLQAPEKKNADESETETPHKHVALSNLKKRCMTERILKNNAKFLKCIL